MYPYNKCQITFQNSVSYELIADKNGKDGLSFFYIDKESGQLFVKRPLTESLENSYTVS